jgi:hypothetical protein
MRRPLAAAAVLTGALLLSAACSTGPGPAGAAPQPTPPAGAGVSAPAPGSTGAAGDATAAGAADAAAGDAALQGDTKAICTQATKTGGDFAATFAQDLELLIDAASASDRTAVEKAEQKTARDVQNYSYALTDLSQLAGDTAVKKALADMGKQVSALKGDVRDIDEAELAGLRATLDRACGSK